MDARATEVVGGSGRDQDGAAHQPQISDVSSREKLPFLCLVVRSYACLAVQRNAMVPAYLPVPSGLPKTHKVFPKLYSMGFKDMF